VSGARNPVSLLLPSLSRRSQVETKGDQFERERQAGRSSEEQQGSEKGEAMIYKPKGRKYFKVKFHFQGQLIHKATRARTKSDARTIEATLRSELAKGNWGILEMKPSALTQMALFCDPFTLARIAGHSSITITQRYCHPQAEAVEAAFSKFGSRPGLMESHSQREA
jgi:hypothetical protein